MIRSVKRPVVSSDIDGVINNYPKCFLDFIYKKTNRRYQTKDDAKLQIGKTGYQGLKHLYRESEYKYSLPYQQDGLAFYRKLNDNGIPLIFSTSRPFEKYPQMFAKTKAWLDASGIHFDALIKKNTLNFQRHCITHHIDDEVQHVMKLRRTNEPYSLFVINRNSPQRFVDKNDYKIVNSFDYILDQIEYQDG